MVYNGSDENFGTETIVNERRKKKQLTKKNSSSKVMLIIVQDKHNVC